MRLTQVLRGPPVFHFWKDFGAGKRRKIPYFRYWKHHWRTHIPNQKVIDYTLGPEKLPPGSRIMDAEDFMQGHIDAMPDEIIRQKNQKIVYDHPWPFNVQLDPVKNQEPWYCYNIETRFFTPRDDSQVLTNTIVESDKLEAKPPLEPTNGHIETIQRHFDWATKHDSVLVKLPRAYEFPRINRPKKREYGPPKERQETNVLNFMSTISQDILAKYYNDQHDSDKLDEILGRKNLAYPHCQVPFERDSLKINLDLFIDSMTLSQVPLPLLNESPETTRSRQPLDISPRTWRSILEKSRDYTPAWSFTLPRNNHLHTIHLASRIKRSHRDHDEMLARSLLHGFGLTSQYARLRCFETSPEARRSDDKGSNKSAILDDPLNLRQAVDDKDILDQPIVLQIIGLELPMAHFYFTKYQLNTLKFDDCNPARVKNQAWHSGPISDLGQALRFYLDFTATEMGISQSAQQSVGEV